MSNDSVIVTIDDLRMLKYCSRGSRQWLGQYGVQWKDFLANGVSSDVLEKTGDVMAIKAIEVARGRKK